MNATIRDKEILGSIPLLELGAYLRSRGWREHRSQPKLGTFWLLKDEAGDEYEVAMPHDRFMADFSQRMNDLLRTLEAVENRSQLDILRDIVSTASDVVSIPANYSNAVDGSIPINDGVSFTERARDLMLAAACATVEPRAAYLRRRPTKAIAYLKTLRLGLPERGSYVLNIFSRVPPPLKSDRDQTSFLVEEPFERQVTTTLAQALEVITRATSFAAASGDMESVRTAIKFGVSANLCEALVGLRQFTDVSKGFAINFSWSRTRPAPQGTPSRVLMTDDVLLMAKEVGRVLRATSPQEDFKLRGIVVQLKKESEDSPGHIVVIGFVEGHYRRVNLELGPNDYNLAIAAHKERSLVSCWGDLVKEGKSYRLQYPRRFTVEADDSQAQDGIDA